MLSHNVNLLSCLTNVPYEFLPDYYSNVLYTLKVMSHSATWQPRGKQLRCMQKEHFGGTGVIFLKMSYNTQESHLTNEI